MPEEARTRDPRLAAEQCELGAPDELRACVTGLVNALIDNTWDGRYALPFCTTLRDATVVGDCFERSLRYLRQTFEKSTDELRRECATRLTHPQACLDATGS